MKLILDLGSGNTCRNDKGIVREMIDAITNVNTGKHEIILKWQLFESAPPNVPLNREVFNYAYQYAETLYKTTASVFDRDSLEFLQMYDVPFIKIACRPDLYSLCESIDACYLSVSGRKKYYYKGATLMACVSKYPASLFDYQIKFPLSMLKTAVSDHTVGWDLYNKYKPQILEKHFVLTRDSGNPDAGAFAVTAEELRGII